jgi:hypothetical protein
MRTAKEIVYGADPDDALRICNADRRSKGLPTVTARPEPLSPALYVNHGRWVADCICGASVCPFESGESVCLSCGRRYRLKFPPQRAAIEQALAERPREENRNWSPRRGADGNLVETVQYLRNETEIMSHVPMFTVPRSWPEPNVDLKTLRPDLAETTLTRAFRLDDVARLLRTDQVWGDGGRILAAVPQAELDRILPTIPVPPKGP